MKFKYTLILVAILFVYSVGCDGLFDVENVNSIEESQLNDPALINSLSNSAEGALSRRYGLAVMVGEMPGDNILAAQTEQSYSHYTDQGIFRNDIVYVQNLWDNLSSAQWNAENVTEKLIDLVDDPSTDIGVARNYYWDALSRITLADLFEEVPLNAGQPQSPVDIYEGAIELLKKAADIFDVNGDKNYLAATYTTISRAYRSLYFENNKQVSDFDDAAHYAGLALSADSRFRLNIRINSPGSINTVFDVVNRGNYFGLEAQTAKLKDPVTGDNDPRIQLGSGTKGISSLWGDSLYIQMKYPDVNADFPVSRWQEAELILAEYEFLINQDYSEARAHIKNVRDYANLQEFTSNDAQEIENQIIHERHAEFWLELRRWQDMRYYNIIPPHWSPDSKAAGMDRRFPVSVRESSNNPNM